MNFAQKPLPVGKTIRYSYTVGSNMLAGDTIQSATVTTDGLIELVDVIVDHPNILFHLTGVNEGESTVLIEFATETQTDCDKIGIYVERIC